MVKVKYQNRMMKACIQICEKEKLWPPTRIRFENKEIVNLRIPNPPKTIEILASFGNLEIGEKDDKYMDITITDFGKSYFERKHVERCKLWRDNIMVPIGVSVVTTILIKLLF